MRVLAFAALLALTSPAFAAGAPQFQVRDTADLQPAASRRLSR